MIDVTVLALVVATLAQAVFCVSVLSIKAIASPNHLLLAGLFVIFCFASGGPVVETFAPAVLHHFYILTLPAYLLMPPLLWFYISWLTAERPWRMERRYWWQFLPGLLALIVILFEFAVSPGGKWYFEEIANLPWYLSIPFAIIGMLHFALFMFWMPQSVVYLVLIVRRLVDYRSKIKTHFASHEGRGLGWLFGFLGVFMLVWIAALITLLAQNVGEVKIMPKEVGAALFLLLVWSLGLLGLSQRPGFEGDYVEEEELPDPESARSETDGEKYQRSALGKDQSDRIAAKIEHAMERDRLYLDPSLSLNKLARHTLVSPNHISQTLNETLGACFFDYVNGWRIRSAESRILSSDKTILEIALEAGFNARSSFYKAFKRETGKTPSEYRKAGGRN